MVVVVRTHDVEDHPPVGLCKFVVLESEGLDALKVLVVAVGSHQVVVEISQRAERDHMEAFTSRATVEAFRHEMAAWTFGEELAGHHVDAGRLGHFAVGEFDTPIRGALAEPVAVSVHADAAHAV